MLLLCRSQNADAVRPSSPPLGGRGGSERPGADALSCEQVVQLHRSQVLDNSTPDGARAQLVAVSSLLGSETESTAPGSRIARLRVVLKWRAGATFVSRRRSSTAKRSEGAEDDEDDDWGHDDEEAEWIFLITADAGLTPPAAAEPSAGEEAGGSGNTFRTPSVVLRATSEAEHAVWTERVATRTAPTKTCKQKHHVEET